MAPCASGRLPAFRRIILPSASEQNSLLVSHETVGWRTSKEGGEPMGVASSLSDI